MFAAALEKVSLMPLARFFIATTVAKLISTTSKAYSTRSWPSSSFHTLPKTFFIFLVSFAKFLFSGGHGRIHLRPPLRLRTRHRTRLTEVCSSVGEGVADAARQILHRNDRSQADQHDEQSVLHEVLT